MGIELGKSFSSAVVEPIAGRFHTTISSAKERDHNNSMAFNILTYPDLAIKAFGYSIVLAQLIVINEVLRSMDKLVNFVYDPSKKT